MAGETGATRTLDAHMPGPVQNTVCLLRVMVRRVPEMEPESVAATLRMTSPEPLLEVVLLTVTAVTPAAARSMADLTLWG